MLLGEWTRVRLPGPTKISVDIRIWTWYFETCLALQACQGWAHRQKTRQINSTKSINMLDTWFLIQCCFSQSDLCFSLGTLKHLETCRPLLVQKQSCTAAEGLQPVSKKDLLATARHKHRVKTSQIYARVNIYVAVSLKNPINCWPPAVTKRWVEAACVAAPMPVTATKAWTCNRLYKHWWCMEKTHQINKHGRF